jgi:peptidoglycan/xylan/chitin deacetylase (PgdA/CDA1 family)
MRAILTFHGVDDSGSVLSVAPGALRSLLAALDASGHRVVPLRDLLEAPVGAGDRCVALSFDDGLASAARTALPILREAGATATLFLTTGHVGRDNRWPDAPPGAPVFAMMGWAEVEALQAAGWEIEAHSATHPDLRRLPDDAVDEELAHADEAIEQRLGRRPRLFAYPYGAVDARVEARVARRYAFAVTTELAPLRGRTTRPHRVPRLDAYYLRAPRVQARFGDAAFRGWIAARALARRLRGH